MFKILAVICTLGGDCSTFVSEPTAMHPTLSHCEQKATRVARDMFDLVKTDSQFGIMKVGCVSSDWIMPEDPIK